MNRAEKLGGKRKNTVGFALPVLQRRLASSPEAIYKSLVRRSDRLERKETEILNGTNKDADPDIHLSEIDDDEYNAELVELADLIETSKKVSEAGTDRKRTELSTILQDNALTTDKNGTPRKFVILPSTATPWSTCAPASAPYSANPDSVRDRPGRAAEVRQQLVEVRSLWRDRQATYPRFCRERGRCGLRPDRSPVSHSQHERRPTCASTRRSKAVAYCPPGFRRRPPSTRCGHGCDQGGVVQFSLVRPAARLRLRRGGTTSVAV